MSRRGRLLPDVCGYPVSRIVSVDVSSEGDVVRLPVTYFSPNIWGLATLTKLKNRNGICRTIFGTVTIVVHHLHGMNGIPFLTEH